MIDRNTEEDRLYRRELDAKRTAREELKRDLERFEQQVQASRRKTPPDAEDDQEGGRVRRWWMG